MLRVYNHTTVVEKRAPTDESVKLLKEMEEKVQQKVDASLRLENNTFSCLIHKEHQFHNASIDWIIHYTLNGNQHKLVVTFKDIELVEQDTDAAIQKISNALAKDIAGYLLVDGFTKAKIKEFW